MGRHVKVILVGDSLSYYVIDRKKTDNDSKKCDSKYDKQCKLKQSEYDRYASTKRNFMKKYFSLAIPPNLFISLIFDNKLHKNFNASKRNKIVKLFIRNISYNFEKSWFMKVHDYSNKSGVHFHILGYIDKYPFNVVSSYITSEWLNRLDSCNFKLCKVDHFHQNQFSYCFKDDKKFMQKKLMMKMKNIDFYNLYGTKNMVKHDPIKITTDFESFEKFKGNCIKFLIDNGRDPASYIKQLNSGYQDGMIGFIANADLRDLLEISNIT